MSHEPRNPVERAADEALETFTASVEAAGGSVKRIVVYAIVDGLEPNGVSAGHGFGDGGELLAFLVSHATELAAAGGLELRLISTPDIGHG